MQRIKIALIILLIALLTVLGLYAFLNRITDTQLDKQPDANGYYVIDDLGNKVYLPHKPMRIMTTQIYLDNMVLGLVEEERVISVSRNMDSLGDSFIDGKILKIPYRITTPPLETVLKLAPDLLIVHDLIGREQIECYRQIGIPVYVSKIANNIPEVQHAIRGIATVVGESARGEVLLAKMDKILARVVQNIPDELAFSQKSVLVAANHSFYGGKDCMYDDICKRAKVQNGVADLGVSNGQLISKEVMIEVDPDYFLLSKHWPTDAKKDSALIRGFSADKSFRDLQAIKLGHVRTIDNKYVFVGHQNCVWSVQKLASIVYGSRIPLEQEEFLKGF